MAVAANARLLASPLARPVAELLISSAKTRKASNSVLIVGDGAILSGIPLFS